MWYKELVKDSNDGLCSLLSLFKNEDEFIEHFIRNVFFFEPEAVKQQAEDLRIAIANGEKIPVRYSQKTREYFRYNNENVAKSYSVKSFKNKEEAQAFALQKDFYHSETKIKVNFDKDGNYYVRNAIYDKVNLRVSQGTISDIQNHVISHIWGRTENPYFFTSLWNVTLIPSYLSFILDKPDGNSELVRRVKLLFKALCVRLYNPNSLYHQKLVDEDELTGSFVWADSLLADGHVTFLKKNITSTSESTEEVLVVEDSYDIWEELHHVEGNKDFIVQLLEKLRHSRVDFIQLFTSKEKSREICKMSYPILIDVTGLSTNKVREKANLVNSKIYYTPYLFEHNSSSYLVCNNWHTENREMLIEWLTGIQN